MTTGYNIREGAQILADRIADPPRRVDGLCAKCRKPLRTIKPQRGVPVELYGGDPFCSAKCCRAWHGIPDVVILTHGRQEAA